MSAELRRSRIIRQAQARSKFLLLVTLAISSSLTATVPVSAAGQVPRLELKPANARLGEEFTQIAGVRQLANGDVLIGDRRDMRLVRASFARNVIKSVGRKGSGPGEFQGISRLLAMGRDTTLLVDLNSRRWLVLVGDKVRSTVPSDYPALRATGGSAFSADGLGFLYGERQAIYRRTNGPQRLDSTRLLRIEFKTGKVDTISSLQSEAALFNILDVNEEGLPKMTVTPTQLGTGETSVTFEDGWTAIARIDPYRIDWISPTLQWLNGTPIPVPVVPLNDNEKQAYAKRLEVSTGRAPVFASTVHWAESIPPFLSRSASPPLIALADGRLLVARVPSSQFPKRRYDVISRTGKLLSFIELPANQFIIGAGPGSIYVVNIDHDGIQRLSRHPVP